MPWWCIANKSMLSNYGLGFAVFSDRFLEGSPLEESWLMRSACRQHLSRRQIHVAVRGSAARVSPHVYNDEGDLANLTDALSELVSLP
jgi:hypothetical protein